MAGIFAENREPELAALGFSIIEGGSMKKPIVEVKRNEIFCDSHLVARKFKVKPKRVVEKILQIKNNLSDFKGDGFVPLVSTEKREYRGQEYVAYLMNRDFFMLLVPKFNTKASRQWQGRFFAQFNAMEKALLSAKINRDTELWVLEREAKKKARKTLMDVVKDFVIYAMECDSRNATFYYKAFTDMTYNAVGIERTGVPARDTLTAGQLEILAAIEAKQSELITECMAKGTPYKKIYRKVKKKISKIAKELSSSQPDQEQLPESA